MSFKTRSDETLQKKDLLSQVILRNFKKEVTTPPLAKQITTGLMIKMLIFVRGIMLLLSLLLFCSFLATKSGFWPTKERADSNFLEETSYYNDFKPSCAGRVAEKGTYLVNKYYSVCASYSTNRRIKIVPILFTTSLGSSIVELVDELVSRGFSVNNQSYEIGTEATIGWSQLFEPNPLSLIFERNSEREYRESTEIESVLFRKIVHQISDPLQSIDEGKQFCGKTEVWEFVSSVTPYINFYLSPNARLSGNDQCIRLLMYHWWSWNRVLHSFSDLTYLVEEMEFFSVCKRSFEEHPDLVKKCRGNTTPNKQIVSREEASKVLSSETLYRVDCELANRIFYLAVEYGYESYESVIRKCGLPE